MRRLQEFRLKREPGEQKRCFISCHPKGNRLYIGPIHSLVSELKDGPTHHCFDFGCNSSRQPSVSRANRGQMLLVGKNAFSTINEPLHSLFFVFRKDRRWKEDKYLAYGVFAEYPVYSGKESSSCYLLLGGKDIILAEWGITPKVYLPEFGEADRALEEYS